MFAGKPIIAVGGVELRKVVEDSGAGFAVCPGNPSGLAEVLNNLTTMDDLTLAKYSNAGKAYYEANFAFNIGLKKIFKL